MTAKTAALPRGARWRTVFHVTHENSLPSIRHLGLLPSLSRRAAKRVWLCDLDALEWAIEHVSATQKWGRWELAILRVTLPTDTLIRHRTGVYYVYFVIPPESIGARLSRQY